jgi:peptidoglycan/xylan/chitin deacetylase (PgdA/CDA1 family)
MMTNPHAVQSNSHKQKILKLLKLPGLAQSLAYLTNTQVSIFMLHRFSVPDLGISGHDPAALRANLAYLRKNGYQLLSIEDVFRRLIEGETLDRTVAFTIDDGYFDHAEIAAPVFAEFDCPVTCFVTTGFLDGTIWFWWDRLTFMFESTQRREFAARLGGNEFIYRCDSAESRARASADLNLRCQDASEEDRMACIADLSRRAEVELPVCAPLRFAPMSWDQARKLESQGVRFGPHTVTHPVLGTTSTAQAEWEITESWLRLKSEVCGATPIFCYPNGRSQDVGDREISTVQRLGLWGGLMAHPGKFNAVDFRTSAPTRFRVPRFGYSNDLTQILQCLSGVETLKAAVRRGPAPKALTTKAVFEIQAK